MGDLDSILVGREGSKNKQKCFGDFDAIFAGTWERLARILNNFLVDLGGIWA